MRGFWRLALLFAACLCGAQLAHADDCTAQGFVPIHALGAGGSGTARIRGVVTAVFPGLHGYVLEAAPDAWDKDKATPEGLFVFVRGHLPRLRAGLWLVLAGHFRRFHGMLEFERARIIERCGRHALPPAVVLDWPLRRAGGWRGLLGMRVRFARPFFVTGLADAGRYGEILLAAGGRLWAPTALTTPGPAVAAIERRQAARSLWLDDGATRAPRSGLSLAGHRFDAAHPLRAGQKLRGLEGIAWHAFGRDLVEPTGFALDRKTNPRRAPGELALRAGPRVVSFNVENYFNHARHGPAFPTERGARDAGRFACQTKKLVAVLAGLRPALAGLEEIENDGYGPHGALAHLVAALNGAVPDARYRYVRPATKQLGTDLIAPALIYDSRLLAPVGRVAVLAAKGAGAASTGLARPALAASFAVRGSDLRFSAAVIHLRSKRDACGRGLDGHSGAGHCAGARAAAIVPLLRWLESRPMGTPIHNLLLLGDFNAYPKERAIRDLEQAGWVNLVTRYVAPDSRYTESWHGRAGELDYFFANPPMAAHVAGAAVWHSDADEPRAFAYDGRLAACARHAAPWRASDHDPVIVVLRP